MRSWSCFFFFIAGPCQCGVYLALKQVPDSPDTVQKINKHQNEPLHNTDFILTSSALLLIWLTLAVLVLVLAFTHVTKPLVILP